MKFAVKEGCKNTLARVRPWVSRNRDVLLIGLALGLTLFGLGYWLGKSFQKQEIAILSERLTKKTQAGPVSGMAPNFSTNPSAEMTEFLQNRATLTAKMTQMRNSSPNGVPNPQSYAQFQQQNASLIQRQTQLAQIIAHQQTQSLPLAPLPLDVPPNASPQLQDYLTLRDQLMRDQGRFMDQHRDDDPALRKVIMSQWHHQHEAQIQQLQLMANDLAQAKPILNAPHSMTPVSHAASSLKSAPSNSPGHSASVRTSTP